METAFIVLLVGMNIIVSILIKSFSDRIGVAPIIGYMGLGFLLHVFHLKWDSRSGITYIWWSQCGIAWNQHAAQG